LLKVTLFYLVCDRQGSVLLNVLHIVENASYGPHKVETVQRIMNFSLLWLILAAIINKQSVYNSVNSENTWKSPAIWLVFLESFS